MTAVLFVDTNVFIYTRSQQALPKQQIAQDWVERLWREGRGRTSIQVLNEFYWVATRKADVGIPSGEAWRTVATLLNWDPLPITAELMDHARQVELRYHISWWDSLVVAAAQRQDCEILLTEDLQHGMEFGATRVLNPFRPGVSEDSGRYAVPSVPRHRPRGRPRKAA
jgi:predicted nucleic acid-binding protein